MARQSMQVLRNPKNPKPPVRANYTRIQTFFLRERRAVASSCRSTCGVHKQTVPCKQARQLLFHGRDFEYVFLRAGAGVTTSVVTAGVKKNGYGHGNGPRDLGRRWHAVPTRNSPIPRQVRSSDLRRPGTFPGAQQPQQQQRPGWHDGGPS